jgi:hypothetical protein
MNEKKVLKPFLSGYIADLFFVEEEVNAYIIAPKRHVDAKTFAEVAEVVMQHDGFFIWLGKGCYYFKILR